MVRKGHICDLFACRLLCASCHGSIFALRFALGGGVGSAPAHGRDTHDALYRDSTVHDLHRHSVSRNTKPCVVVDEAWREAWCVSVGAICGSCRLGPGVTTPGPALPRDGARRRFR
jgi:hypothetical protein